MADNIPSSSSSRVDTLSQNEVHSARKKQKANPPDFPDSNSLVTFIIVEAPGNEEIKFTVHKEIACYHSPVLNAAFNSSFIEGETQTYRLEDTTSRAFKLLVQWLYFEKLRLQQFDGDLDPCRVSGIAEDKALVEVWVLADKLCMPRLQNEALKAFDAIREKTCMASIQCLSYAYHSTPSGSLLRKYCVQDVYQRYSSGLIKQASEDIPRDLLIDLATLHAEESEDAGDIKLSSFLVPEEERSKSDPK